jgi:hypothetical protein
MSNADLIKQYLVGLGFSVDDATYQKFNAAMNKAGSAVEKHTNLMSNSYVKAALTVTGAIGTIIASTTMMLESLAKADLGYEKYAMRMFMAKDAAKQFSIVTKAMGESLEDIAWNKELNAQYKGLMGDVKLMELPKVYGENMKMIRGIGREFTRLKVESVYGLQWIGHNIVKNLMDPIKGSKLSFEKLNDYIIQNIPAWSKKIADTFTPIIGIITDCGKAVGWLIGKIGDLWASFSKEEKIATFGAALLLLVSKGGAVGIAIAAIGLLTLAISDFYGYLEGKRAVLPAELFEGLISAANIMALGFKTAYVAVKAIATLLAGIAAAALAPKGQKSATLKAAWEDTKRELVDFAEKESKLMSLQDQQKKDRLAKNAAGVKLAEEQDKQNAAMIPGLSGLLKTEGNDPNAIHPRTGAIGVSQIMPENWDSWAKEAGLGENVPKTKENQELITRFKYGQYLDKYKDTRLAQAAWFGGEGAANALQKGDMSILERNDKQMTIGDYIKKSSGQAFSYPYTPNAPQGANTNVNVEVTIKDKSRNGLSVEGYNTVKIANAGAVPR